MIFPRHKLIIPQQNFIIYFFALESLFQFLLSFSFLFARLLHAFLFLSFCTAIARLSLDALFLSFFCYKQPIKYKTTKTTYHHFKSERIMIQTQRTNKTNQIQLVDTSNNNNVKKKVEFTLLQ